MKNLKNKGFLSFPTLLVGTVLILVGIGVYLFLDKNIVSHPQNPLEVNGSAMISSSSQIAVNTTSTPVSAGGWITLRAKRYGVEIQYPPDWHFYDSTDSRILHGITHIQLDSFPSSSYSGGIMPSGGSSIAIYRSTSTTPEQAMWSDMAAGDYLITPTSTTVNGIGGLRVSYTHILGIQNTDVGVGGKRIAVYLPYHGYTYAIIFDSRKNPIPNDLFDEFLSRFEFISSNAGPAANSKIAPLDFQFALDLADDRVLVGASHNVFVGKVISQVGTKEASSGSGLTVPVTQFSVGVISTIKGNLQGAVMVNQAGGYQNGVLYTVHGGDTFGEGERGSNYLLQLGATYLFATRYDNGVYDIWPYPGALTLIDSTPSSTDVQLRALSANNDRVIALQRAYPREILWSFDIRDRNTRNSYQSLGISVSASSSSVTTSTATSSPL